MLQCKPCMLQAVCPMPEDCFAWAQVIEALDSQHTDKLLKRRGRLGQYPLLEGAE